MQRVIAAENSFQKKKEIFPYVFFYMGVDECDDEVV